jgi:hypothetical protein
MKNNLYPSIKENMTKWSEGKILTFNKNEQFIYNILHESLEWKNIYEIVFNDEENIFWIKHLKGIAFNTKKEAELYCFLDYCEELAKRMRLLL